MKTTITKEDATTLFELPWYANKFFSSFFAIIGLFIPAPMYGGNPVFTIKDIPFGLTITIGKVPIGIIMIIVALIF